MSIIPVSSSPNHSVVNSDNYRTREAIIYVNGINNTRIEAENSALMISGAAQNTRIVVFYNPTLCLHSSFFVAGMESTLANRLVEVIQNERNAYLQYAREQVTIQSEAIHILILAHSHGAVLVELALRKPEIAHLLPNIEVAAFGGAKLLYNGLASKVNNFINEMDFVPLLAMCKLGNENADGLEGYIGSTQKIVTNLIGIHGHENPYYARRLESAREAHQLVKFGHSPQEAQQMVLVESCRKIVENYLNQSSESDERRLNNSWLLGFERLFIELAYNVEILTPNLYGETDQHSLRSYLPKIIEVTNRA